MNKKELLRTISQLERKVEKLERNVDGGSVLSYESRATAVRGKIRLDGSLEDRLDQLDKRESELLEMLEKNRTQIKQLTEERNRWKRRCEDLENTFSGGRRDTESTHDSRAQRGSTPRGSRPPTAGSRPPSARRQDSVYSERPLSGRVEKGSRPPSAKRRTSIDSGVSSVRKQKIQAFKENRSAKTIQRRWRSHQSDQASDLIRSALMGHTNRRQQLGAYQSPSEDEDYETEDENYNECVGLIQSSILGHNERRAHLSNTRLSSTGEEDFDDDDDDIIGTPKRRPSSSSSSSKRLIRPQSPKANRTRPQSGSSNRSRPSSAKVSVASYSRRSLAGDDDDDF